MSNVVFFFGYSCMIFFALAHPAAPALAFHNIVLGWFPPPGKQSGVDTERNDQKAELRSLAQFGAVPETGALWYPTSRPDISLRERDGGVGVVVGVMWSRDSLHPLEAWVCVWWVQHKIKEKLAVRPDVHQ